MQNRVTKVCHLEKNKRADKLRRFLQLTPSESILLDACARKTFRHVKELLEALSNVNPDTLRDQYLRTPLHIACSRTDDPIMATSIARLLINKGSDVNNGVGDVNGLYPLHMAVLAGNYQCVLMLLHEGASIPASDPFRLTPLLLAKLRLDNLRQTQHIIHGSEEDWMSVSAKSEYDDLVSITQVLVSHLATKHITSFELPSYDSYHGLSDFLFQRDSSSSDDLNQTILNITDKLASIGMTDSTEDQKILQDSVKNLIEKVKTLGL